jgi:hypothetical protein
MNECIWDLAGVWPALGACITAQIFNIDGRLRALLALLKFRRASQTSIDAVNRFAEEVRGPSEKRNRIIHDPWGIRPDGIPTRLHITANKKLRFDFVVADIPQLQKDMETIKQCVAGFVAIRKTILDELPTLQKIPESELRPIVEVPNQQT